MSKSSGSINMIKTLTLFGICFAAAQGQALHIEVDGLRNDHGAVRCFLYNSEKGYPKDQSKAISKAVGSIQSGKSSCDFPSIPNAMYAVSVYHDENNNNRLDSNFIGIPKEGVGASNDAKGRMGPPKYQDAAIAIDSNHRSLVIHIHYL